MCKTHDLDLWFKIKWEQKVLLLEQRLFDNYAGVMVYVSSMKIFRTSLFLNEDKNVIFSIWKTSSYIFFDFWNWCSW